MTENHIVVIDPAVETPATEAIASIERISTMPVTTHQPVLKSSASLNKDVSGVCGLILLGSMASVHDTLTWKDELVDWLRPVLRSGAPVLGICFGHQLIAHEFGGKIEFLNPDKKHIRGFRSIRFQRGELWNREAAEGELVVSHREGVTETPLSMRVIGTSSLPNDALRHETLPIWTMQAHPETTPRYYQDLGGEGTPDATSFVFGNSLIESFVRFTAKQAT